MEYPSESVDEESSYPCFGPNQFGKIVYFLMFRFLKHVLKHFRNMANFEWL